MRDESTEKIRIILEPKNRNIDPEGTMEILFRSTDLQTRFNFNMNALVDGMTPQLCSLKELLNIFLDHRKNVLVRRTKFRINQILDRLELLNGYLLAYLNLDRVIAIIRNEDEPKIILQKEIQINERQAEAILNLRLRALRRLEEEKIKLEFKMLDEEKLEKETLLNSNKLLWKEIALQIVNTKEQINDWSRNSNRLTQISDAVPDRNLQFKESMIVEEDVTVLVSQLGWVRMVKGHLSESAEIKYREGDTGKFIIQGKTTDKLIIFCTNGRAYTIDIGNLPSGRGFGEPLRLMIDIPSDQNIISVFIFQADA